MVEATHDSLTQDEVYDLLSNGRRRFVISYLRECGEPVDVMDLSQTVAAWENDTDVDDLTDQQIKRVYVSLYQTHIPKLDESGIVSYDRDAGTVTLTSAVSELDSYLPNHRVDAVPWRTVYLLTAVVGLVLYGFVTLFPIGVSPLLVGFLVILAFGVVAATHYTTTRRIRP